MQVFFHRSECWKQGLFSDFGKRGSLTLSVPMIGRRDSLPPVWSHVVHPCNKSGVRRIQEIEESWSVRRHNTYGNDGTFYTQNGRIMVRDSRLGLLLFPSHVLSRFALFRKDPFHNHHRPRKVCRATNPVSQRDVRILGFTVLQCYSSGPHNLLSHHLPKSRI